jgi:hypothetical protein
MNCWTFEDNPQWFEQCCEVEPKRYWLQLKKCQATEGTAQIPSQLQDFKGGFQSQLERIGGEYLPLIGIVAICSALALRKR